MEIKVEDLQMGDEFLYSVNGTITRAKVIRPVVPKKVQPTYSHYQGKVFYKAVKCKVSMEDKSYTTNWQGNRRIWTRKEYTASDNYTVEKFVDLNYRNLWLLKRED
jgi:hypothetical protein